VVVGIARAMLLLRCLTMYRPPLRAEAVRFRDLLGCRVDVHAPGEFAHAFSVIIALMLPPRSFSSCDHCLYCF
jgi:hypothetical protein